ncbi:MAG: hypothetical protein IK062_07035 [Selenomonadaceae bacterium]|nr:hypothetical protein [Selenomonadaceae bacterium]
MDKNKIFQSDIDGTFELCGNFTAAEEILTAGNSFFDRSYFGTRILVLAQRPGDEILIAGNIIFTLAQVKAEIFIAYSVKEKINFDALKILGVQSDKIIFFENWRDLKNLLIELRANIIFCADYDSQTEFKNLSSDFENAMGEILHEDKTYRPEVYKKFACATALNSPPDFYAPNLLQTKRPKIGATDNYNFEIIDRANYSWKNRVRFPVHELCQKTLLKENPVANAILSYKNFRNDLNALRILNSDEIFFERKTDNQIFSAKVSDEKISDFKILDVAKSDKFIFEWAEGVQVQKIILYGDFQSEENFEIEIKFELDNLRAKIDKAGISLDNTFCVKKILPAYGLPLIIDTEKIFVKRAEISSSKIFGLGEVEFFANAEPFRKIQPFIKLTTGDNFFYKYDVPSEVEKIPVGVYKFHVDDPVKISAESNDENILTEILEGDEEIILNLGNAAEIILTAEVVGSPNIYDRAIIRRVGDLTQIQMKIFQWLDKISN